MFLLLRVSEKSLIELMMLTLFAIYCESLMLGSDIFNFSRSIVSFFGLSMSCLWRATEIELLMGWISLQKLRSFSDKLRLWISLMLLKIFATLYLLRFEISFRFSIVLLHLFFFSLSLKICLLDSSWSGCISDVLYFFMLIASRPFKSLYSGTLWCSMVVFIFLLIILTFLLIAGFSSMLFWLFSLLGSTEQLFWLLTFAWEMRRVLIPSTF